jgi:Carboxypeptidase regulatory-like domain
MKTTSMRTTTRKNRPTDPLPSILRGPRAHRSRRERPGSQDKRMKLIVQALCAVLSCASLFAQEPPAPPTSQSSSSSNNPTSCRSQKEKPIPSFLILGTVFNERDLSFPGVRVRIRRTDEKKFRWETYSNSRGEFAVRVPPGCDYEVVMHVKNYQDQSKAVDSSVDVQQRLSIKLEPSNPDKAGSKP